MQSFDSEELLFKFRYPLLILLSGLVLTGAGFLFFKKDIDLSPTKIEVLSGATAGQEKGEITAEISGAVMKPGVYKMPVGSRVEDLLVLSGGFSGDADRSWTNKYLNRAAKINDGQKIYIPSLDFARDKQSDSLSASEREGDQTISASFSSDSRGLININSASLTQLDTLPGIGQVYGQSITEHRPYSNVSELLSKGVLRRSVYEKIKDLVTVY